MAAGGVRRGDDTARGGGGRYRGDYGGAVGSNVERAERGGAPLPGTLLHLSLIHI